MSGHVIATPVFMPALQSLAPVFAGIAAGAGGSIACVGLAISVKKAIDIQAAAAIEHQLRERAKLKEWAEFQIQQRAQSSIFQKIEQSIQAAEQRLMALEIASPATAPSARASSGPEAPVQRGAMALGRDRVEPEQFRDMLRALGELVSNLPQEFRDAEHSPFARLAQHNASLSAKYDTDQGLYLDELLAFKETISRTLDGFLADVTARREQMAVIQRRLDTLLNEVLFYEHFATSPRLALHAQQAELGELRAQITALLDADHVTQGALETIEKRLSTVKSVIDKHILQTAHNQVLPYSLATHLTEMGYELLDESAGEGYHRKCVFRIPGGEQLHAVLHHNGQLAFEVLHERDAIQSGTDPLSRGEAELLRKQEQRWCNDVRELVRRLAAEGFPFTVNFEQAIPASAVKVVVVETPEEILSFEAYDDATVTQKRYLA